MSSGGFPTVVGHSQTASGVEHAFSHFVGGSVLGSPLAIPGTIEAEDFDGGGEGAAYHDASRGNDGNAYRATDVDIETTGDTGGGWNVGWTEPGDWSRSP